MFLCFYGNVLVTSFTVILRPLDYGTATRGNPGFTSETLRPQFMLIIMACFGKAADVRCQSSGASLHCGPTNTAPEPCKFLSGRTVTLQFRVIQLYINCLSAPLLSNTRLSIREDIQFCGTRAPMAWLLPLESYQCHPISGAGLSRDEPSVQARCDLTRLGPSD
jgi:hypothetical protein